MSEEARAPQGIDVRTPSPARMYDYFLGGKDNYRADRETADKALALAPPGLRDTIRENRRFLQRAVRFLTEEAGIRQFIDIGAGLPTQGNVHEIARRLAPESRVVYVDNDPVVLTHAHVLLEKMASGVTVIEGDMRRPDDILAHPELLSRIDFDRPVAVLLVAVLHFVTDEEAPAAFIRRFRDVIAPGSYLVLSHASADGHPRKMTEAARSYDDASAPMVLRSRDQVASFFDGFDLVDPGLVSPEQWRPVESKETAHFGYAGVGRKTS